jgi:hypothetical protein
MRKWIFFISIIALSSCRPYYIKDRHFDCKVNEYQGDSDIKELIYRSLKRAVVAEKDIPDYVLYWKKHKIYVSNAYQTKKTEVINTDQWMSEASFLSVGDVPPDINNVEFCLKSKDELQRISNRTRENFLHLSFRLIQINGSKATIKIDNTWVTHKNSQKIYLSGGGYTAIYNKIDGVWRFESIITSWIS